MCQAYEYTFGGRLRPFVDSALFAKGGAIKIKMSLSIWYEPVWLILI